MAKRTKNPYGGAAKAKKPAAQGDADSKFEDTPAGWAKRWAFEFKAARGKLKKWWDSAEESVLAYTDDRGTDDPNDKRLTLFTSNVQTIEAMLYGKIPSVDVDRRFEDSEDDAARVGGEMLGRILNTDIERDDDTFALAMRYALGDRLIPGLGVVRLRYVCEWEKVPGKEAIVEPHPLTGQPVEVAPAVPPTTRKSWEDVETDYVYWKDQLWSPCRTHHDKRWHSFQALLDRKALVEKFGKEVGNAIPLNAKSGGKSTDEMDADAATPWARAIVHEIWDKENRCQWFYVEGYDEVIVPEGIDANPNGSIPDPLELAGFWPFPRPLIANTTTSAHVPKPDYKLAKSLYDEINKLTTRLDLLEDALRVAGVYDGTNDGIQQILSSNAQNQLIPVKKWDAFTEKGGIAGAIQWMPLQEIVQAIEVLDARRTAKITLLFQITGLSDIMRGEAMAPGATATEQSIKARFGSVRMQTLQDEVARFASDAQRIKAEIISKHFEPETIAARSNLQFMPKADQAFAQAAIELVKSKFFLYRIQVRPESVSLTDYAALKQERTEVITSIAGFIQVMGPLAQQSPTIAPHLFEMLGWLCAGTRGGKQIEGILKQAGAEAQKAAMAPKPPAPPDPKLAVAQLKTKGDLMKAQLEAQNRHQEIVDETKSGIIQETVKAHAGIQSAEAKERARALHDVNAVTGGEGTAT